MAKLFNFDQKYKFGIPEVDNEHSKLVDILNDVNDLLVQGKRDDGRKLFKEKLTDYINTHFRNEEKFLEKMGYPDLEEHKKVHIAFKESFNSLTPSITSSDEAAFRKALNDGYMWLISHIGMTDKKYANFYLSRQQNP